MPFVYDIHLGNTRDKIIISEGKSSFYGRKFRFTAPRKRNHKTQFATIKPTFYLPKSQF